MGYGNESHRGVIFSPRILTTNREKKTPMAWIKTVSLAEADEKLRKAIEGERALYPKEYADPVHPDPSGASSIVGSHTLIPDALYHAFSTFSRATRDDRDHGLGHQPVRLLNRVPRRVSASRHVGQGTRRGPRKGLHHCAAFFAR